MNKELELSNIFKIAEGVRARNEDFGLLIVSKTTPAMSVNMDGKFVWELIDGKNSLSDIISKVNEEYELKDVKKNVCAIIDGFLQLNLISVIG